jgi:DNA-directed RNA polymerase subunit RPC12/RpoP
MAHGGHTLDHHNQTPAKPTNVFKKISGPHSDGGGYALYTCGNCRREFAGGQGVVRLPNKKRDRVVQCPHCGCVDPSWKNTFRRWRLIAKPKPKRKRKGVK